MTDTNFWSDLEEDDLMREEQEETFPDWGATLPVVAGDINNVVPNHNIKQEPMQEEEEEEQEEVVKQEDVVEPMQEEEEEAVHIKREDIEEDDEQPQQHQEPPSANNQQQQQQEEQQEQQQQEPIIIKSGVDGKGLWKSWTHNYEQPRFAVFDLLDNCFDATLRPDFHGKVMVNSFQKNGMVILNNSCKPTKSLEAVLTAYRSEKNNTAAEIKQEQNNNVDALRRDAIGEYGVGLKQACATLSSTSFVLTKNSNVFDFGVIAESLQTIHSVSFPHYSFSILRQDEQQLDYELTQSLTAFLNRNENLPVLKLVSQELGAGNRKDGIQTLVDRFKLMCTDVQWKPHKHVFQLLITDLIHTKSKNAWDLTTRQRNVKLFFEEMRSLLPKYYINIPQMNLFDFYINDKRVLFSYWQHRLVEMTKFEVFIPKDTKIQDMKGEFWYQQGYPLSIYCGFDSLRVENGNQPKTCQLNIYSCSSGRLISVENDARALLGLASSGVDYSQGITVIVDDFGGELPLKPTKDGIAWSKDAKGEAHKNNLLAWIGAVVFVYWKYHASTFEKKCNSTEYKTLLTKAVKSFAEPIRRRLAEQERMARDNITFDDDLDPSWKYERLERAKFTMFPEFPWTRKESPNDLRVKIRKSGKGADPWPGVATVFKFEQKHFPSPEATPSQVMGRRRGRPSLKNLKKNDGSSAAYRLEESSSSGSEQEEVIVQSTNVARRNTMPSRMSFGGSVAGLSTFAAHGTSDKSKIRSLERKVASLQSQLQDAQQQVLEHQTHTSRAASPHVESSGRMAESLHSALSEVSALKSENERLRLELQQKDQFLQRMHQENGIGGGFFGN